MKRPQRIIATHLGTAAVEALSGDEASPEPLVCGIGELWMQRADVDAGCFLGAIGAAAIGELFDGLRAA